uniref:HD-GYP domain-containing protein n=1 Tax=Acetatifactor sp. TaxID=1872090 RepID=UPI004056C33C
MKRLSTLQLVPGMIVAENVLSFNRQLVISKGTILTDKLITKLDLYGILTIYVEDLIPDATLVSVAPRDPSYSQRVKRSEAFKQFKEEYNLGIDSFRDVMNNVVEKNMLLDVDTLLKSSLEIAASGRGKLGILDMLHNMRDFDDSTYAHCMNVALICNLLATWLRFSPEDIELATACGLFHDIGKLLVPRDIITKPGKLSNEEYAEIQKHTVAGYHLLLNQNVDDHVRFSALMHHERYDGSGYPMRVAGSKINKYARIVAIADVYDAMTAARVYRGPLCPFRVIEIFESEGYQKYDAEFLLTFLENVVNTYIQNRCRLSDGREGDIIFINKDKLSRPIVQCGTEYVNLLEETELTIAELL